MLTELFADPKLVSRDMINDILRYKRVGGVAERLGRIAASRFNALLGDHLRQEAR